MLARQMLAGRREERHAIDALVAGARLGHSGVLVLCGDPGIGKTTLMRHALAQATGFRVLRTSGTDTERDLPFAGLSQLLDPLSDLTGLPEPQARALGVALALRAGEPPDRFAVSAGVLSLLTRASEARPTLVLVDDAHLLDRSSTDALIFAARRLLADAVLVLVALRDGDSSPWLESGLALLALDELDEEACSALIDEVSPVPTGPAQRKMIARLARGNPLAVRELARDPDLLVAGPPGVPPPVPALLAQTFGNRVARLSDDERLALAVAALADGDPGVTTTVLGDLGLDVGLLSAAEESGLVTVTVGAVEFAHPLLRAVVAAGPPPAVRRRLHDLVADALPAGATDLRALHRAAALLGPDDRVARDVHEAAERAAARGAFAEAASAFERAALLSSAAQDRSRLLFLAGDAAWRAGEHPRTARFLADAAAEVPTPELSARIDAMEGMAAAKAGSLTRARDSLFRAAAQAEAGVPGEALLLYSDLIDVCFYLLDTRGAARAADLAEPLLARVDTRAAAVASVAIGMARVFTGEPAVDLLRSGVAQLAASPSEPQGDHVAWDLLGPMFLRESDTGRELVRQAEERSRFEADLGNLPHLLFHLARYDATGHHWQRGTSRYVEAIELARETHQSTELAMSLAGLAWLAGRQGREDVARTSAAEALELALAHDVRLARVWASFAVAELDLAMGDTEAATRQFTNLDEWLKELNVQDPDLSPVPELVECLVRAGRSGEARDRATSYAARAATKGQPWSLARAHRVNGLLAEADDAETEFEAAIALHEGTPDRFEEARTRLAYGERLRRAKRRIDARGQLRAAAETFESLGARLWVDRAHAELSATGLRVNRRTSGPVTDLTERELQISLLLAEGRTTRQVAAALFLSPKTVEYHLRHVYTKLGASSRSELSSRLAGLGA